MPSSIKKIKAFQFFAVENCASKCPNYKDKYYYKINIWHCAGFAEIELEFFIFNS